MEITINLAGEQAAVVQLRGRLDLLVASEVKQRLAKAVQDGFQLLVIDMSDVSFVDSSGLGALIGGLKAARMAGGDLRLASVGAQAILHDPDLVILDEPTSALDPLGRRRVREVIQYLKERGKTVFLNSHLLSEVERSCDQVAIINKGRVVVQGTLDELLVNRSVVRVELKRVEPRVLEAAAKVAQKIHPVDEQCFTAEVASEDDIPELARAVLDAGGALIGLQAHRETLEDLFVQTVEAEGK